jgi:glycosyltransferase involved in cell wall biosynthesis
VTQATGLKTVSCVLLTLNEEGAIAKVVADIRHVLPQAEIVVVDSSSDKTAEIAEDLGCKVVRQIPPKGYGWAMDAGFKKASGDYIITMDCDDTYPSEALPELVKRMDAGADMVSCSRMKTRPSAMKLSHFIANRLFALTACILCGVRTTDVHTGMRAYRKQILEKLPFDPEGMALPVELQIAPQRMGFNCQEFFIDYRPRIGESKIVPLEGTVWTFRRIWRWRKFLTQNEIRRR